MISTSEFKQWNVNNNSLVISELSAYYKPVQSSGVALKYVLNGSEVYCFDNQRYTVPQQHFLLTNCTNIGKVEIESNQKVLGVCINLSTNILAEVSASILNPNSAIPDVDITNFLISEALPEQIINASQSATGHYLQSIGNTFLHNKLVQFNVDEIFVHIAEKVVVEFMPLYKHLHNLKLAKLITQKLIYKKLAKAKSIIENEHQQTLNVQLLATEVGLSLYHFIRLFKKCYNTTPMQMLVKCRMEYAKKQLQLKNISPFDIASNCGYADVQSFSKAFKKYTHTCPTAYKNSNFGQVN